MKRTLLAIGAGFLVLAFTGGCATQSDTVVSAPTEAATSPSEAATAPSEADLAVMDPSGRLADLIAEMQASWDTDTKAHHKEICAMWTDDPDTMLTELTQGADYTPMGLTDTQVRDTLTGFFDTNCGS